MRQFQSGRNAGANMDAQGAADTLADSPNAAASGVLFGTNSDDVLNANAEFPHVIGLGGDDQITGSAGNNILEGNSGEDTIASGAGVDSIWGGEGVDTLTGGGGRDRFAYQSLADAGDTITDFQAGRYGDVIDVSAIAAQFNWDPIDPFGAGFITMRQSGTDTVVLIDNDGGGDGYQSFITLENVSASSGLVTFVFDPSVGQNFTPPPTEPGAMEGYTLTGTPFNDVLYADSQFIQLVGLEGEDHLFGSVEDNILDGGADHDVLVGDAGNDRLDGGTGFDWMEGGAGDDAYIIDDRGDVAVELAGNGFDVVISSVNTSLGANIEALVLTGSGDHLQGIGNDLDNSIIGTDGINELLGSSGNDWLYGLGGSDRIYGDGITDVVFDDDFLFGGAGDDWLYGGKGNDTLNGGEGADTLSGSLGNDTVTYEDAAIGVGVDLTSSAAQREGAAAGDFLSSIENLVGTAFDDRVFGGGSANILDGLAGNDQLHGRDGADTLRGGEGNDLLDGGARRDVLTGGAGEDTFYFASAAEGGDTVTDFTTGDHIGLSAQGFGINSIEDFAFVLGATATDDIATALYDSASGRLSWDADGSGAGQAVVLATLTDAPTLAQDDFLVI